MKYLFVFFMMLSATILTYGRDYTVQSVEDFDMIKSQISTNDTLYISPKIFKEIRIKELFKFNGVVKIQSNAMTGNYITYSAQLTRSATFYGSSLSNGNSVYTQEKSDKNINTFYGSYIDSSGGQTGGTPLDAQTICDSIATNPNVLKVKWYKDLDGGYCYRSLLYFDCSYIAGHEVVSATLSMYISDSYRENNSCLDSIKIVESMSSISDTNYSFQCSDKTNSNEISLSNYWPIEDYNTSQNISFNSDGLDYLNNSTDGKFRFLIMVCADYYSNNVTTDYSGAYVLFDRQNVSLNINAVNNVPNAPQLINPLNDTSITDTTVDLSWYADDPDNDSVYCILYFGTDSLDLDSIGIVYNNFSTDFSTQMTGLSVGEVYYWRVIVKDEYGGRTVGPVWSFYITSNPPATPTAPSGPEEGLTGEVYTYMTSTTDPDGDSIYYQFDWGDSAVSDWLGPYVSGDLVEENHSWEEPGEYLVKVRAKDYRGALSNWSDRHSVNIYDDSTIIILSPSGGEEYEAGDSIEVRYKLVRLSNEVYFYLSYNSGNEYFKVDSSFISLNKYVSGNLSSIYVYNMRIPDTLSDSTSHCKIKITYRYDETKYTEMGGEFFIEPKRVIEIIKPNSGEKYEYNGICNIEWVKYGLIDSVDILYSLDGGSAYSNITVSSDTAYQWHVPDTNTDICYIKISDHRDGYLFSTVGPIAIYHNRLIMLTPERGTEYEVGDSLTIKWDYTGIIGDSLLKLQLLRGDTLINIADSLIVGAGYYDWSIPLSIVPYDSCVILGEVLNSGVSDTTDEYFTIRSKRILELSYPEGGEYFIRDSLINITWGSNYSVGNVALYYRLRDTYTYRFIANGIAGSSGNYSWRVPAVNSNTCRIKIVDETMQSIMDTTKDYFTITDTPYIKVEELSSTLYSGGDTLLLQWNNRGVVDSVYIKFSEDGGVNWSTLYKISNIIEKEVELPLVDSKHCKLKVEHWLMSKYYGESEEFEVKSGSLYVKDDSIFFENVFVGSLDTIELNIYNNSTVSKVVDSVKVYSQYPDIFRVIGLDSVVVPGNDSVSFYVIFSPKDTLLYEGGVQIYGDGRVCNIEIRGEGELPILTFNRRPAIEELTDSTVQMSWGIGILDSLDKLDCYYYFGENNEAIDCVMVKGVDNIYRVRKEGLKSNNKYYYYIKYYYSGYNVLKSKMDSIITLERMENKEVPITKKPKVLYVSDDVVSIGFETDELVEGLCALYKEDTLILKEKDGIIAKKHIIKFNHLKPSTKYTLIPGVIRNGEEKYSNFEIEVKTQASPDTIPPRILRGPYIYVTNTSAVITLYATEACRAVLSLYNSFVQNDETRLYDIVDTVAHDMHQFILSNLKPRHIYSVIITLTDLHNNSYVWPTGGSSIYSSIGLEKLSKVTGGNTFNTNKNADTLSPQFTIAPYVMSVYDSLVIIKLQTDEQSKCKLYIYESDVPISYIESQDYEYTHRVYITRLLPGRSYNVTLEVEDQAGNKNEYNKQIEFITRKGHEVLTAKVEESPSVYYTSGYNIIYWKTDIAGDAHLKADSIKWGEDYIYNYNNEIDESHIIVMTGVTKEKMKYMELKNKDYYNNEIYSEEVTSEEIGDQSQLVFEEEPDVVYNYFGKVIIYCKTNIVSSMKISYKELLGGDYIDLYDNNFSKTHKTLISGLKYGTNYEFKVSLLDVNENELNKNIQIKTRKETEPDTIKPLGVNNMKVSIDTAGGVYISWTGSGAYDLSGYNIYRIQGIDTLLLMRGYGYEYYIDDNVPEGKTVKYGVEEEDISGNVSDMVYSNELTGIKDIDRLSNVVYVNQNYPNPFTAKTIIEIISSKDIEVEMEVNDILGKVLLKKKILLRGQREHKEVLDLSRYPAGIYFYSVKYGNKRIVKKMLFVK